MGKLSKGLEQCFELSALWTLLWWASHGWSVSLEGSGRKTSGEVSSISPRILINDATNGAMAFVASQNNAPFEAGNIGQVLRLAPYEYRVSLRSDNDDALPEFWRRWWYFKLENIPTDRPVTITLVGAGQWAYYVPLFFEGESPPDESAWTHFSSSEVDQPNPLHLRMRHQFKSGTVYLARFVPYGLKSLLSFLKILSNHRDATLHIAGLTPEGRPIPVISFNSSSKRDKPVVFIHARTHPGEVGSSYLLEGFLYRLLESKDPAIVRLREGYRFEILPVLNVDGVYVGNNRVTPGGINLEGKWYSQTDGKKQEGFKSEDLMHPFDDRFSKHVIGFEGDLDERRVPHEVQVWHRWIKNVIRGGALPVAALNLHTSSVNPREGVFVFPHFGPKKRGYSHEEARLYESQALFVHKFMEASGSAWFLPFPDDGGRHFLTKSLPETWWWNNFGSKVMALTIESTYGLVPGSKNWITPKELRKLGSGLTTGLARYLEIKKSTDSQEKRDNFRSRNEKEKINKI